MSTVQPVVRVTASYGQEHNVPSVNASGLGVKPCKYFTTEVYSATDTFDNVTTVPLYSYRHIAAMLNTAWKDTLTSSFNLAGSNVVMGVHTNPRCRLYASGVVKHLIRNQTNESVVLRAYYCKARGNVPSLNLNANYLNIYQWLSNGFCNSIGGSANTPLTSAYMSDSTKSPFDSHDFCRDFKIYKVKSTTIQKGAMHRVVLRSKTRMFKPLDHFYVGGTNTGGSFVDSINMRKFAYARGTKFILFRLEAAPAGWGATQSTVGKQIQCTTPTVIMETEFLYRYKFLNLIPTPYVLLENTGIAENGLTAPSIMQDDEWKAGVEAEAP